MRYILCGDKIHLNPIAFEGISVSLIWRRGAHILVQDVVQMEPIQEADLGVSAGVADHVPGEHVLHDGDGSPLAGHALHVLHQPEDGLGGHEGGGRQRRGAADEGEARVGVEHRLHDVLQSAARPQQLEVLLILRQFTISK